MKPELIEGLRPAAARTAALLTALRAEQPLSLVRSDPPSGIRAREIFTARCAMIRPAGGRRGRFRRHRFRHEDAGDRRRVRDEVWIGNLTPAIDDKRQNEASPARCRSPLQASRSGRASLERHARHEADYPLSFRFDETRHRAGLRPRQGAVGALVLHNNGGMSRRI